MIHLLISFVFNYFVSRCGWRLTEVPNADMSSCRFNEVTEAQNQKYKEPKNPQKRSGKNHAGKRRNSYPMALGACHSPASITTGRLILETYCSG